METKEYAELRIGDTVGDTERTVIACTKKNERVVGDVYATWVAICLDSEALHPYVVWTVVARPEGWLATNGDYCQNIIDAIRMYKARGGFIHNDLD